MSENPTPAQVTAPKRGSFSPLAAFRDLRTAPKLFAGFAVVIVLMVFVGGLGLVKLGDSQRAIETK